MRSDFFDHLLQQGKSLPRRQEAESETTAAGLPALVQKEELRRLDIDVMGHVSTFVRDPAPRRVSVCFQSISHTWESMEHPDPFGYQLDKLARMCCPENPDQVVWVFYDFVSLFQYGGRSEYEEKAFREALQHMHTLYAHEKVNILVGLKRVPSGNAATGKRAETQLKGKISEHQP